MWKTSWFWMFSPIQLVWLGKENRCLFRPPSTVMAYGLYLFISNIILHFFATYGEFFFFRGDKLQKKMRIMCINAHYALMHTINEQHKQCIHALVACKPFFVFWQVVSQHCRWRWHKWTYSLSISLSHILHIPTAELPPKISHASDLQRILPAVPLLHSWYFLIRTILPLNSYEKVILMKHEKARFKNHVTATPGFPTVPIPILNLQFVCFKRCYVTPI